MICKTVKSDVYTKMFFHSGLFFKDLCLGCQFTRLPSEIFKPAPYKSWSEERQKKEGMWDVSGQSTEGSVVLFYPREQSKARVPLT